MKKHSLLCLLLIFCVIFSAFTCSVAANAATEVAPAEPEAFTVDANAAMLIDLNSNRVIYEQNADARIYPASLTKIMSCLIVLENANLSDIVTIDEGAFEDIDSNSSTAGLKVGEQMTLENLLYCVMISSGNEACNAAAIHVAGSTEEFVRMMNERAQELGCYETHFSNVHGLHDEEHYTTARDLVRITQAALKSATFKQITDTDVYKLPATNLSDERLLRTTNMLIYDSTGNAFYYPRASGIKTGYTTPAGRCVISTAEYDGLRYLAVVCGAKTTLLDTGDLRMESFPECIRLFNYGFEQFAYRTILSPLYPVTQVKIRNSAGAEHVALAPSSEIRLLLPTEYDESLLTTDIVLLEEAVDAPIAAGSTHGRADVYFDGELLATTELIAIADVAKSEISEAAAETSSYIQQNWWRWVVAVIVLAIIAFIAYLIYCAAQRRRQRHNRMQQRRRSIEQSDRDWY